MSLHAHQLTRIAGLTLSDRQHDLLIRAHLAHSPPLINPAIELMSTLAANGTPLPQSSYNILLSDLASSSSNALKRGLAQDLFVNMRLTAHPAPSAAVYTTMISACANSRDPQPERARDLWIEMTESGIQPERAQFDAIIRALSSTKKTYLEAFDLFRQMLAKHAEATFVPFDESDQNVEKWSRYVPTAETFKALLEGTKRAGDLNRARWVLNEVVRLQASGLGRGWKGADNDLMSGVFMTYASWTPVIRRTGVKKAVRLSDSPITTETSDVGDPALVADPELYAPLDVVGKDQSSSVRRIDASHDIATEQSESPYAAPLTSADAIREADALFDRLLMDTEHSPDAGPFSQVRITPRLVNAYLSVHLAHAPSIASARKVWDRTWISCGKRDLQPTGWSFLHVLERCAAGDIGSDRQLSLKWANDLWNKYLEFAKSHDLDLGSISALPPRSRTNTSGRDRYKLGLGPRQLERSFRAMIRIKALSPSIPSAEALDLTSRFHTLFPPSSVLSTYSPNALTAFKIRMTDPTIAPESEIPPIMLWRDVDVLHQRLVREGRRKDIGWLTWVCKSYEVALRTRKRWRLKKRGEKGLESAAAVTAIPEPEDAGSIEAGQDQDTIVDKENSELIADP